MTLVRHFSKDPMIYLNSRPIAKPRHQHMPARRFEWRFWADDTVEIVEKIVERYTFEKKERNTDRYFLVPGRANQISRLNDDETFEIRTLIDHDSPLELWETSVKSTIPMKRSLASMIGVRIPKFSGPVTAAMSPEDLTETLKKKSHFYCVNNRRKIFKRGNITVKIAKVHVNDNEAISIAFESPDAEPLMAELKALGLRGTKNVNFGGFLRAS